MLLFFSSLPTPFHFEGEPLLAQWDNELNIWRTGRVKDVEFDMGKLIWYVMSDSVVYTSSSTTFAVDNSVTFETYHFSPLAIMTVGTTHCAKNFPPHTLLHSSGSVC